MQRLRENNSEQKFNETLSQQTISRLVEKLCNMKEGQLKDCKRQSMDKLRDWSRIYQKRKAVCYRVLDLNFR